MRGPKGAGKTTTLRMLLGLVRPTSGHASVAGYPSSSHPEEVKRRVGLVTASAGLYQQLTVQEMLLFFADLYGLPPAPARASLAQLSEVLRLDEFLRQRWATLSTGPKQRVTLARPPLPHAPVLLLHQ